ncbi:MAG: hypothetical protein BroJett004_25300 [Planctomycetota bacterium]|nr:MAG: hypothetical protein BroJett004_25300 [Planctomycetota bacterium]
MQLGMLALRLAERLRNNKDLVAGLFSRTSADPSPAADSPQSESFAAALVDHLPEEQKRQASLGLKLAERLRADKGLLGELFSQTPADQAPTESVTRNDSAATTVRDHLPDEQARQAALALKLGERIRGDEGLVAELFSWSSADQSTPSGASQPVETHVTPQDDHLPEERARLAALGLKLGQLVQEGEGIVTPMFGQATSATEPQPGHGLPENARRDSGRTDPARGR